MQSMNEVMPKKADKVSEGKTQNLNEVMPKKPKLSEGKTQSLNEDPKTKDSSGNDTVEKA